MSTGTTTTPEAARREARLPRFERLAAALGAALEVNQDASDVFTFVAGVRLPECEVDGVKRWRLVLMHCQREERGEARAFFERDECDHQPWWRDFGGAGPAPTATFAMDRLDTDLGARKVAAQVRRSVIVPVVALGERIAAYYGTAAAAKVLLRERYERLIAAGGKPWCAEREVPERLAKGEDIPVVIAGLHVRVNGYSGDGKLYVERGYLPLDVLERLARAVPGPVDSI